MKEGKESKGKSSKSTNIYKMTREEMDAKLTKNGRSWRDSYLQREPTKDLQELAKIAGESRPDDKSREYLATLIAFDGQRAQKSYSKGRNY